MDHVLNLYKIENKEKYEILEELLAKNCQIIGANLKLNVFKKK